MARDSDNEMPPLAELWPAGYGQAGVSTETTLGTKARNYLARAGLQTAEDVISAGRPGLSRIRGFGQELMNETERALAAGGFPQLSTVDSDWEPPHLALRSSE